MKTSDITSNILDFFSTELYLPTEETLIPKLQEQKYLAIYINPDDLDIQVIPSASHESLISENDLTEEDLKYIQTLNIGDLSIDFAIY